MIKAIILDTGPLVAFLAAMNRIERFLHEGWIQIAFQFSNEQQAVMNLMKRYRNIPMSFADACLVRMAELDEHGMVFTLDRHFRVYRKNGKRTIPLIIPDR